MECSNATPTAPKHGTCWANAWRTTARKWAWARSPWMLPSRTKRHGTRRSAWKLPRQARHPMPALGVHDSIPTILSCCPAWPRTQADSLFRLLGWGEDLSDPDGSTGELINRLLRRALHVAELREHQVNVLRRAKAEKAERLRELNLQLSRVSQVSNEGKGLLARIAQLKAMQLVVEDPDPVDWDDEPWRQDELQELQQQELERQQRSIARRMARRREKRQHDQASGALQ
ncbi:SAM domain-containing protein [Haematococcus lacustris]|uniref:SAM domain-containing protein n=1 Tax=Haematococcus lacustris TaxID=44745 RepID=A0A699ZX09_HAELA|nr:SAM domain-containing protein [Haematococcus lacustris]